MRFKKWSPVVLLAIDTSTSNSSIALFDGRGVVGETTWRTRENHTRSLMPQIVNLFDLAGCKAGDVSAVGVATGPGSFTGLRIGLSAAKGIAFSLNAAVVGIPTLDICASALFSWGLPVCAVLQAGRGRFAAALYEPGMDVPRRKSDYFFGTDRTLAAHLENEFRGSAPFAVGGELEETLRNTLRLTFQEQVVLASKNAGLRRAGYLGALAWRKWQAGDVDDLQKLAPYYIPTASLA